MDRFAEWKAWLDRVIEPVIAASERGRLSLDLPPTPGRDDRQPFAATEAFCRSFCGVAPWLQAAPGADAEAMRGRVAEALGRFVHPRSEDPFSFHLPGQPLVEAAFLSHGLLRAPKVWQSLDATTRDRLVDAVLLTRQTLPPRCNWLLFSAMVEAFMAAVDRPYDKMRIDYAVQQHEQWYLGDGVYGDGPHYHADYYNSYVIQPMLLDIVEAMGRVEPESRTASMLGVVEPRFVRAAAQQERAIGPDGSYPASGRSICYRCGAFQLLAQAALQGRLPDTMPPAQAREALSAAITRTLSAPSTFTDAGWLNPGLAGHQPGLAEHYISRGSLYLCTTAFLPLGLDAASAFWADPPVDWTGRRLWNGQDGSRDHALD
ncbi:MAG: DUF2264 domain-containing protein [Planctomycetota bacterium]